MFEIIHLGCEMFDDGPIHTTLYQPTEKLLQVHTSLYNLVALPTTLLQAITSLYNLVATSHDLTTSSYNLLQHRLVQGCYLSMTRKSFSLIIDKEETE